MKGWGPLAPDPIVSGSRARTHLPITNVGPRSHSPPPRDSIIAEACPRANPAMKIINPTIKSTKEVRTGDHAASEDVRRDWKKGDGPGVAQGVATCDSDPVESASDA